jgi:hypothetical protein
MNELKIGDVVYLNSEDRMQITVSYISDGYLQGVYFNVDSKKIEYTPKLPIATVTKAR